MMEYNFTYFNQFTKLLEKFSGDKDTILEWESTGLPNEKYKPSDTGNKVLSPKLLWNKSRLRLRFEGSCLKQEHATPFTPNNVVTFFIVYE